jgi:hypothetical protein
MPGFDRKGPMGQGSRTGRGLGKCNSQKEETVSSADQEERPRGRGLGRGLGRGRGKGRL